jgi:hypothetical protein
MTSNGSRDRSSKLRQSPLGIVFQSLKFQFTKFSSTVFQFFKLDSPIFHFKYLIVPLSKKGPILFGFPIFQVGVHRFQIFQVKYLILTSLKKKLVVNYFLVFQFSIVPDQGPINCPIQVVYRVYITMRLGFYFIAQATK